MKVRRQLKPRPRNLEVSPAMMRKLHFSSSFHALCLLSVASLLSGCMQEDMSDLQSYVADVKGRNKAPIEPLPEIKVVEPFVFRPNQVRDPFEPDETLQQPEEVRVETGIRPDTLRAREELESYELDTLRMVGTVRQEGVVWALVNAKEGTIHRVRVGNYIGKNYGKVVNIMDNKIELVEIFADSSGAWRERKASVTMADEGDQRQ
jgi:type IV pilus assembly protein PilP